MLASRSSSHLEQGHGRFLPGPVSSHGPGYHHSRGGGGGGGGGGSPLNFFASYSNSYENSSSSYLHSHPPSSPLHTTHSQKHKHTHSHSPGSSQPTSPCLDSFSTTAWLGSVAEDEEVPVSVLHHHHRPSRTRLKDHHPSPTPPLRLASTTPKRAPPSLPFSPTGSNLDDFTLKPIASIPEPLNSWFQRRKSEELELVHKRRFRPKMSPPQQQQPPPVDPQQYWGYLISSDHPTQPTPLFRSLLLSIANYIVSLLLLLLLFAIVIIITTTIVFSRRGFKENFSHCACFPLSFDKLTILACVNCRSITWSRGTFIALHLKRSLGSTD